MENEEMLITNLAGDAMTVIRGINNTTAVPHDTGDATDDGVGSLNMFMLKYGGIISTLDMNMDASTTTVDLTSFSNLTSGNIIQIEDEIMRVTDWMGDLGFLRNMTLELPNHFLYEDTMWVTGEVLNKSQERVDSADYFAVEVRLSGHNQLGQTLVEGKAVIYLPEKGFLVGLPIGNPWW